MIAVILPMILGDVFLLCRITGSGRIEASLCCENDLIFLKQPPFRKLEAALPFLCPEPLEDLISHLFVGRDPGGDSILQFEDE